MDGREVAINHLQSYIYLLLHRPVFLVSGNIVSLALALSLSLSLSFEGCEILYLIVSRSFIEIKQYSTNGTVQIRDRSIGGGIEGGEGRADGDATLAVSGEFSPEAGSSTHIQVPRRRRRAGIQRPDLPRRQPRIPWPPPQPLRPRRAVPHHQPLPQGRDPSPLPGRLRRPLRPLPPILPGNSRRPRYQSPHHLLLRSRISSFIGVSP